MKNSPLPHLAALAAAAALSSCATAPVVQIDSASDQVLNAMCDKLAAAQTLRVEATRKASPGLDFGIDVPETARGTVAVRRPNQLAAHMKTSRGEREIGLYGGSLLVVDRTAGTHASVSAPGGIDSALAKVERDYGVTPPIGILLANHPRRVLLDGVTSVMNLGTGRAGSESCDHLAFKQEDMTWELWVSVADKLPRRIVIAYANPSGGAPLTMDATITRWELNPALSEAELVVAPPSGSREVEMVPLPH